MKKLPGLCARGLILIITLTALSAIAEEAPYDFDQALKDSFYRCGDPKSKLYRQRDPNEALNVTLITDYSRLSQSARNPNDKSQFPGVMKITLTDGPSRMFPVLVAARGNSRRDGCEAPPLRLKFLSAEITKPIEEDRSLRKLDPNSPQYLFAYYRLLRNLPTAARIDLSNHVTSTKYVPFSNLGDDVKLVSHCGVTLGWERLGGKTPAEQDAHFLREYYMYQIAALFGFAVERVRLARVAYLADDGQPVQFRGTDNLKDEAHHKFAMFREPPRSVAERCGLLNKNPGNAVNVREFHDPVSAFQAQFINTLFMNTDYNLGGHNMNVLYDQHRRVYFSPYDYDLARAFDGRPDLTSLKSILRQDANSRYVALAKQRFVEKKPVIRQLLENSLLNDQDKAAALLWLNHASGVLEK